MCRTTRHTAKRGFISIQRILAAIALLMLGGAPVWASQSPSGCTANNLSVNISKDHNNVTNGTVVTFGVTVENPAGGGTSCDITLGAAGLVFTCPGPDGNPTGTQTVLIPGGTTIPAGSPLVSFSIPCTVNVTTTNTAAQAKVDAPGAVLHDNPLQDDPANINKTLSVNVFRPCIDVTKECDGAPFEIGTPIRIRGTVRNCGDVLLQNVTVVDDHAGTLLGPITLAPGASSNYTGQYIPVGNPCGPFTDTVTATGVAPLDTPVTVTDTASATCPVVTAPCIDVTKTCPATVTLGSPVPFSGSVSNCGNVTLTNVIVSDNVLGIVFGPVTLAPHTAQTFSGSHTVTVCGPFTDTLTASGADACTGATVMDTASCTTTVLCPPHINVDKQVACVPSGGNCEGAGVTYGESATGVEGAGFCYKITVVNDGADVLNNVAVSDPDIPGVAGAFPSTFAIGQSETRFFKKTWPVGTHQNTVTANGVGASTGISTNDTDTATAVVVPIGVECSIVLHSNFDMDAQAEAGQPDDNHVTLGDSGPVDFSLTVRNTGQADLSVAITGLPCSVDLDGNPIPTTLTVPAGASTNFVCSVEVSCPQGTNITVSVTGTAVSSTSVPCVFDSNGNAITTGPSTCAASVNCQQPVTCRVTGGGVLTNGMVDASCIPVVTTISPLVVNGLTVNKVTHGGQLGAPFSQMDCGAILGNPCIRGQWQHTRHYQGKGNPRDVIDMNFHSVTPKGQFDSLFCACLGCCDPATGVFIPPSIGPLVHKFALCNPDDHKVCGPMPRPAPANAIIFSGLGRLTPTSDNGVDQRKAEWVVFRVYIEDRSEPGGFHPKGAIEPADIYCFQAWKTGILTSKKPDFSTIAADFRQALGQANCDFVNALSNGQLPIGSLPSPTVDGVTADIQDCGAMLTGNHQIHPSTGATCTQ